MVHTTDRIPVPNTDEPQSWSTIVIVDRGPYYLYSNEALRREFSQGRCGASDAVAEPRSFLAP
jgi:hypothetical protein